MQAKAAQTNAAANMQNAATNAVNAETRQGELSLSRRKAKYENKLTAAKTRTEKAKRKEALTAAKANRARQEYTDMQSSWYAVDEVRQWVPVINLGGK